MTSEMDRTPTIARRKIRRLYYIATMAVLVLTMAALAVPTLWRVRGELSVKIDQLSEGIIDQKMTFLEAVVVEKISDIERIRTETENRIPALDPDEVDYRFRAAVREMIHTTELPDDGYIWINEIVDFSGGDNYAFRFAHPNLADTEGDYLSTRTVDIAGNLPYLEELEGVRTSGEVFFDYYFQKPNSTDISHKLTYARLYEPYNWVVATGVYLDDVDVLLENESAKMELSTNRTIRNTGIAVLLTTAALLIMTILFESRIQGLINSYGEALRLSNDKLLQEKTKLENAFQQIRDIAYTDFLTGLWNRRAMMDRIQLEVSRTKREESCFGIIMCDVDRFKRVNDEFGHEIGDCVLAEVANILSSNTRAEDSCARWGGEEFLVMVVGADRDGTAQIGEKLRSAVEEHVSQCGANKIEVSITVGFSIYTPTDDIDTTINVADRNLYRGKREGRNVVIG